MLLVSEIRPDLQRRAQELIPDRYESLDELLNVALENQLNLERQRLGTDPGSPSRPSASPIRNRAAPTSEQWAELRSLARLDLSPPPAPRRPNWGMPVLWGQVNRLLPVNAGVRVLGRMLAESGEGRLPLSRWHDRAAEVASSFHHQLVLLDRQAGRKRGDLWATGFPRGDRGSIRRYTGQFLGRGSIKAPGAAEMLGLVSITKESGATYVTMTEAGAHWASLDNPVFDTTNTPVETFSETEVRVYLDILDKNLPEEREFMAQAAALIEETKTRSELEAALARRYPKWKKIISTMRAGAIGRLHDLGLLARTREGTAVSYALSPRAGEVGLIA